MPQSLVIASFAFGAVLILIALLGGNFKLFGAEVSATVASPLLRLIAFILGATFIAIAVHPFDFAPLNPSSSSGSSQGSGNSPSATSIPTHPNPPPATLPPSEGHTQEPGSTGCVVTIANTLVTLMSEPSRFSQELIRVKPGEYSTSDYKVVRFASQDQGWFQIEAEGRTGWIANDTWTIDSKTSPCP